MMSDLVTQTGELLELRVRRHHPDRGWILLTCTEDPVVAEPPEIATPLMDADDDADVEPSTKASAKPSKAKKYIPSSTPDRVRLRDYVPRRKRVTVDVDIHSEPPRFLFFNERAFVRRAANFPAYAETEDVVVVFTSLEDMEGWGFLGALD